MKNPVAFSALLLLTSLLFSLTNILAQTTDCREVKRGEFRYFIEMDSTWVYLERHGNVQIEHSVNGTLKTKVKWTKPCTYTLSFIKVLEGEPLPPEYKDLVVIVTITSVHETYYDTIVSWENFSGFPLRIERIINL